MTVVQISPMNIEIEKDVAKALYDRLVIPGKDADGNIVYTVSLTLAREVREALFEHVK